MRYDNQKLFIQSDLVKKLNRLGKRSHRQIIRYLYGGLPVPIVRRFYGWSLGTKASNR